MSALMQIAADQVTVVHLAAVAVLGSLLVAALAVTAGVLWTGRRARVAADDDLIEALRTGRPVDHDSAATVLARGRAVICDTPIGGPS